MNPLHTWLVAATFAAFVPAQASDPAAALAKAQLLEQQEGDLAAAQQAYRALLDDAAASAVHAQAALRLGTLLWRLDQKDAGKPFLERAAAAGGEVGAAATAVLQGQGEDALLARERLVKAQAMVLRYCELQEGMRNGEGGAPEGNNVRMQALERDLLWLGDPAAQALIEFIELCRSEDRERSGSALPTRGRIRVALLRLLWRIGERSAEDMLLRWSKVDDVPFRREIAAGAASCRVADKLVPVLVEYLKDEDPAGDVWISACKSIERLPMERHVALLGDPDPRVQAAALNALASRDGDRNDQAAQVRLAMEHGEQIRKATHATDPRVAANAWRVLCRFATSGPREGALLFLAEAERLPPGLLWANPQISWVGDDAWMHALADAARRSGPRKATATTGLDHQTVIEALFVHQNAAWTTASLEDFCNLIELGYGEPHGPDAGVHYFWALADQPHLDRYLRCIAKDSYWPQVVRNLIQTKPLQAEVFPTLRDLVEPMLQRGRPGRDATAGSTSLPQAVPIPARQAPGSPVTADELSFVIELVTSTKHPEAAAWLTAVVDRRPDMAGRCANALVTLSLGGFGEPAQAALRKLLVWQATEADALPPTERSSVFAELARVGDVAAIPLFPRAYALGLQPVQRRASTNWTFTTAGVGFLCALSQHSGVAPAADGPCWHGYAPKDLADAWRALLGGAAADRVWEELAGPVDLGKLLFAPPRAAFPTLLEHVPAAWARKSTRDERSAMERMLGVCRAITKQALDQDAELREAVRKVLTGDQPALAMVLLHTMESGAAIGFAPEALQALRSGQWGFFGSVTRHGIDLEPGDWMEVLAKVPMFALEEIPLPMASRLRPSIEAQLASNNALVRGRACAAVVRLYGDDGVGLLLPLLQDPTEDVRKLARECLDTLKKDHEQRAYWNTAGTGVDLRPASAAAKLLTQAKAGQPKDQRLLAIRSLAVLAAAESLPYLIDATKDQDADIATAARTAIAQIHAKSGTPEPAKK